MYFYDTELGYTIVGAWGLRRLITSYSGPIVRIRDTTGDAEQDVYADSVTGELNSFTVTGNAAITTVYDQSGNSANLVQATSGLQPLLIVSGSGNGKPVARFDGVDDYLRDGTASTTRPYQTSTALHISMSGPRLPREQWGKVWCIPHSDGANSDPYSRLVFEQDNPSTLHIVGNLRVDGTQRLANTLFGFNNREGWNGHALVPYIGRFLQAGSPATNFTADTALTYPNSTRLYIGSNGQGTENNGMDWSEHVVYSTSSPVQADIQALVDKVAYDRLIGPNRFYRLTITGSFSPSAFDAGFAEIELRGSVGGADLTTPNTPFTGNKRFSTGESWEEGIDNNDATQFSSGDTPGSTQPVLYFMIGSNTRVEEIYYKARNDTFEEYTMKAYTIARFTQTGWENASDSVDNTSEGCVAAQTYVDAISWPTTTIEGDFDFDYSISEPLLVATFDFDYSIEVDYIYADFEFDYELHGLIGFTFDYAIPLVGSYTFNYKIQEEDGDLLGYKHIGAGNVSLTKRAFQQDITGHTIDDWGYLVPGTITYPESVVLGSVASAIHNSFYGDFYDRIWVSPEDIRLSNPKIGFEYSFYVWNAYDRPNDMIDYVPTDVDGTTFVEEEDLPITFGPIELRTMHFTIDADAPAQIEGTMFFDFTMGGDGFNLFALVLGVLKTLPNEPFNEVWSWYSVLETSRNGTEQRQAVRDQPRTQAAYTVMLLDEEDRRTAYQQLFGFATRSVIVPFFQYSTLLDADVTVGDTRLYFDLSKSDIRAGEYLVLFEPNTYQYQLLQVLSLNADGVNLATPITFDADMDFWEVVPGRSMRLPNKSQLAMEALTGTLTFKGESTSWRDLLRPSGSVTLPEYDGYPVIPYEPIAVQEVDETFDSDVEVIDNDSAPPVLRSTFTNPFIEQTKQFLIDRETEMDWWRTFFDYTKGMLRPFLVPTWRDDLPLAEQPDVGDNELITTNTEYADYWQYQTYKWVQIQSDTGVLYRRVTGINPDVLGLRLSLDDAIGLTAGSNENMVVSFLNLTRLNSDDVKLDHFVNHTVIQIETRTVNQ